MSFHQRKNVRKKRLDHFQKICYTMHIAIDYACSTEEVYLGYIKKIGGFFVSM